VVLTTSAHATDSTFRCRVSSPTGRPVEGRPSFNFGNARIAVALPKRATFAAIPDGSPGGANAFVQRDGWIRTKLGWWRASGKLRLSGRRLDASARPLRADVGPVSATSTGQFIPSLLYFPTVGCWKITATAAGARLEAVVRVLRK
jgi:hypothetical protein